MRYLVLLILMAANPIEPQDMNVYYTATSKENDWDCLATDRVDGTCVLELKWSPGPMFYNIFWSQK